MVFSERDKLAVVGAAIGRGSKGEQFLRKNRVFHAKTNLCQNHDLNRFFQRNILFAYVQYQYIAQITMP